MVYINIGTLVTTYGPCDLRAITDTYSKGNALSVRLENAELVELLDITDVFTDTGKSVLHGFNDVPVWKLNVSTD